MQNTIITITGPSLSGKTTLVRRLQETGNFMELVSHTTRQMRSGEVNGVDYHFLSEGEFANTFFVESVSFAGYRYGLAESVVFSALKQDKTPVVILTPDGVAELARWAAGYKIRHIKVFVELTKTLQYERFIERMLGDSKSSREYYAKRFESMKEEWHWRSMDNWDIFVGPFVDGSSQIETNRLLTLLAGYE